MGSKDKRIERPRSKDAVEYRKLYKTAAWKAIRPIILARDLFTCQREGCGVALTQGRKRPTDAVVNHKERHQGDWDKFIDPENLEAVCKGCHDSAIQSEERGRRVTFGADGWPDRAPPKQWLSHGIPHGLEPSSIPTVLVVGRPCSGKTTWVHEQACQGDHVIDLDDIKTRMFGTRTVTDFQKVKSALRERDLLLASLATKTAGTAYVVMTGKTPGERRAWKAALGPLCEIRIMRADADVCRDRLRRDTDRREQWAALIKVIDEWE